MHIVSLWSYRQGEVHLDYVRSMHGKREKAGESVQDRLSMARQDWLHTDDKVVLLCCRLRGATQQGPAYTLFSAAAPSQVAGDGTTGGTWDANCTHVA